MAIKIHGKLRGESPEEQWELERKRFQARQRSKLKIGERMKARGEIKQEQNRVCMEEIL